MNEPDQKLDWWVFTATEKDPTMGGFRANKEENGNKTTNRCNLQKEKISMKTGSFGRDDQGLSRIAGQLLGTRRKADGTLEVRRSTKVWRDTMNSTALDDMFQN
jgi:hypothetical protein